MSAIPAADSSFDVLDDPSGDELLSAAAAAATRAVEDPSCGVLVIAVRPNDHFEVVSGGGTGVLRAAVSVALAAGNDRLWRDAPTGETIETSTRNLPEVIAAAADAAGVRSVHTGCARRGETLDAIAIWFETWNGVQAVDGRRLVLAALAGAAERAARLAPVEVVEEIEDSVAGERTFDPDDPNLDALTGLATPARFDEILDDFEGDEATVLIVDLDQFALVADEYGDEISDLVVRIVADRLVERCGRHDHIARLGHDRFAVLFTEADRSTVLGAAKSLLHVIAEPLGVPGGPSAVSATMALAHQIGLVDLEDMLDSANAAIRAGKRSGTGKLVLAA